MVTESERQAIVDEEHLRLLPIFYWVLGGLDIFMSLYGLIYVAYGAFFALVPWEESGAAGAEQFPQFIGWFMGGMGLAITLAFCASAALKIFAGFWMRARRRRTACLVAAGITCLLIPIGTIVGVFTFIVLLRPSVAALFAPQPETAALESA